MIVGERGSVYRLLLWQRRAVVLFTTVGTIVTALYEFDVFHFLAITDAIVGVARIGVITRFNARVHESITTRCIHAAHTVSPLANGLSTDDRMPASPILVLH